MYFSAKLQRIRRKKGNFARFFAPLSAFLMFLFYTGIIFFRCIKSKNIDFTYFESLRWKVGIVLLLGAFALSLYIFSSAKGNDHKKEKQNSHWINRDELIKK